MWRTIDAQLRAARLFPSLFSSSSQSQPLHFSLKTIRTFLTTNPKPHHTLCLAPKTLILRTIFATATTATDSISCAASLTVVRCVSSFSPAGSLDWNEPVSCSEVGEGNGDDDNLDEDNKPCIPVRAYFFSTRFAFWPIFRNISEIVQFRTWNETIDCVIIRLWFF